MRRTIESAPPASRAILVRTSVRPPDAAAIDATISTELTRSASLAGGEVARIARAGSFSPAGGDTTQANDLIALSSYERIEDHATLIAGRWPEAGRDPVEASLSQGAASALGLAVGDRISLISRLDASLVVDLTVAGLWDPDRDDAYWLGDPLELDGIEENGPFTTHGPFVLTRDDLVARAVGASVDLQWRAVPDVRRIRIDGLEATRRDVETIDDRLVQVLPAGSQITVSSGLPAVLAAVARSVLVSRSGVTLLTVQFAVLAGYAMILVAGMLLERRRAEVALLRSRGASSGHLAAMAVGEAVLLAVPAAVAAPWLAIGIVRLLAAVGPLASAGIEPAIEVNQTTLAISAGAAVACVLALSLPTLTSSANIAGVRAAMARQAPRTLPQRLGLDLALVALAAIALWQLRLYGAPLTRNARGVLGVDPLLVAAPAIGLLGGAVLALRIVPRLAELGERLLQRSRSLVAPLGGRQLARRPLRYTRSALLLMLAAALGTFAAAHAATWTRSQGDQAAYRSVADLRVVMAEYPDLPSWAVGPAYRDVAGVEAAIPVVRQTVDSGRAIRGAPLIALDPAAAAAIITIPPDESGAALPGLLPLIAEGPPATALELPGRPRRLSVTVDADMHSEEGFPDIPADFEGIRFGIVLEDADGRIHRLAGNAGSLVRPGQRIELSLAREIDGATVVPAYPIRLLAIELAVSAPSQGVVAGTIDLTGVAASQSDSGSAWEDLSIEPGTAAWTWVRADFERVAPYTPPEGLPNRILLGDPATPEPPIFGFGPSGVTYRLERPAEPPEALAAIVGARFLELTGATVGETVPVSIVGTQTSLRIVGVTASFPPLDPAEPFAIVDQGGLERLRFASTGRTVAADEWWLSVAPAEADAVAATLAEKPYSAARVIGRDELTRALTGDPVSLGVIGVLGLGSIAAMVFAAIGFVVSTAVSTTERIGEFAILRALGLSGRQLSAWLLLENVFLLAVGLLAGSGLGLLLAWVVLPFATLTETGAVAVPTPVVVIPLDALSPIYLLAGILLVATILVVRRQLPAIQVSSVLRARDE